MPSSLVESPGRVVNTTRASRQAVNQEEEDDGEGHVIPSFQNAFNDALLTASVSVIAAAQSSGELL